MAERDDSSTSRGGSASNNQSYSQFSLEISKTLAGNTILSAPDASKIDLNDAAVSTKDPTFMQNQISIQRSPSTAQFQASALSRKLSVRSNGSSEVAQPSITGVLLGNNQNSNEDQNFRGRFRNDSGSDSSMIEGVAACDLTKSNSPATDGSIRSIRSAKSAKSVFSVHAVGSYPIGTLSVHSPSPTRRGAVRETREFLKQGDIFVVRDVPATALFGYDTRAVILKGDNPFDGVKDIPSGAHFFWGGSNQGSLRTGFWFMSARRASDEYGEVHVKRWDRENETLEEVFSLLFYIPLQYYSTNTSIGSKFGGNSHPKGRCWRNP
jgi:A1 cistron-splicing factor AAR2